MVVGNFFLCVLQYAIILVVLAAIAGVGIAIGIKLRKNKNAKEAAEKAANDIEE